MQRIVRTLSMLTAFLAVNLLADSSAFSGEVNDKQAVPAIEASCKQTTIAFGQETLRRLSGEEIEMLLVGHYMAYDKYSPIKTSGFHRSYFADGTFDTAIGRGGRLSGRWRVTDFLLCQKYDIRPDDCWCQCLFVSDEGGYFLFYDQEKASQIPRKMVVK